MTADLATYLSFIRSISSGAAIDLGRSGMQFPASWEGREQPVDAALPESRDWAVPTLGASGGVFLALLGMHASGRTVVAYETPAYPIYRSVAAELGFRAIEIAHRPEPGAIVSGVQLAIDNGAQVVCLLDPHNPSGYELSAEERSRLVEMCELAGVVILVDRVFADFAREPQAYQEIPQVIVARSFSKSLGLGADRFGWLSASAELRTHIEHAVDLLQGQPRAVDEELRQRLLGLAQIHLARNVNLVRHNNLTLQGWIQNQTRLTTAVNGSALPFAEVHVLGLLDARAFARGLRERTGTAVLPGEIFGLNSGTLRVGLTSPKLDEGLFYLAEELSRRPDSLP